jgi:hypothetical protein
MKMRLSLPDSHCATASLPQPWPRGLVADPVTWFQLDAPVRRRELDEIRERLRTGRGRERDRDRRRLHQVTHRLGQLLCATFLDATGGVAQ